MELKLAYVILLDGVIDCIEQKYVKVIDNADYRCVRVCLAQLCISPESKIKYLERNHFEFLF